MVSNSRGRRRIYWDSCVWLYYVNEDTSVKPTLDALLADSSNRNGDIELITSVISQTEVAYAAMEQQQGNLDDESKRLIDSLWYDRRRPVTLVEFHSLLALQARDLMREANIQLKLKLRPMDAIHLTTARHLHVTEFHTYDKELPRFSGYLGFPIIEPYIKGGPPARQDRLDFDEPENT